MDDATFKLCIFGDGGVGKTTLTERFLTGLFKDDARLTIGTNFFQKTIKIKEKNILLQIWDFGGERKFRSLVSSYVKGASGALFMYDITRFSTLKNVKEWMDLIEEGLGSASDLPIILIGGKIDLEDRRAITLDMPDKLVEEYGFMNHILCSAKTGLNVEKIFIEITQRMVENADLM